MLNFYFKNKRILKFGCSFVDKIKIFLLFVLHSISFKEVKIKYNNKIIILYNFNIDDLYVIKDMFLEEEYKINLDKNSVNIILDLGANSGLFSIYAGLNFPQAFVYSFEPDRNTFEKLKKNTAFLNNIKIFNLSVSDTDGEIFFYSSSKHSLSSSIKNRGKEYNKIKIPTKKLNTIIEDLSLNKISILKFDIEGAEDVVFKNFKYFKIIDYMIGEIHLDLISVSEKEFLSYFTDFSLKIKRLTKYRFLLYAKNKKIKY